MTYKINILQSLAAHLLDVKTPPVGGKSALSVTDVKTFDDGVKSVKDTEIDRV